jgi:hypothetical protein
MSFNLGDWAAKLQCEMCDPALNLTPSSDALSGALSDRFWDEPPDPPDSPGFDLPDYYPSASFPEDGIIININGIF